ncbi:MAG: SLATT domain-containing protein [Candidatus Bathyarchaeia archaeon]|jgi:hypothetical protein
MSTQAQAKERLQKWRNGIKIDHNSHLRAATHYTQRSQILGAIVVIFTTIVGTAVFTSIASNGTSSVVLQILAGFLSIIAAVLSSLNTFLNYGKLAESHRSAAVKYGNLRREIEQLLCFMDADANLDETMKSIRTRWDAIDLEAPEIPQKIHDKVKNEVQRDTGKEK